MSLIYLLSSLPALELGQQPRLTLETFRAQCREQLGQRACAVVTALLQGTPSAHPFVQAWHELDKAIRNTIARERARKAGFKQVDAWEKPVTDLDLTLRDMVITAMQHTAPLERERALDKIRWARIDDLAGHDPMHFKVLLAYALKLTIALRWGALDPAKGQEHFEQRTQLPENLLALAGTTAN